MCGFYLCVVCVCLCLYGCVHMNEGARGVRFPVTGVVDCCDLPNMDAENQTLVLWKRSKFS